MQNLTIKNNEKNDYCDTEVCQSNSVVFVKIFNFPIMKNSGAYQESNLSSTVKWDIEVYRLCCSKSKKLDLRNNEEFRKYKTIKERKTSIGCASETQSMSSTRSNGNNT